MKKDNIVLIGMPGVGKSTAGVILAKVLGYEFVDADLVIQKEEGKLLKEIIEEVGTDGFIAVENRVNSSLEVDHSIIATGGSVVYGKEAMEHLKSIGTVVYLQLPFEELNRRLSDIKGRGVVLKDGQTLKDLYEERVPLYEKYADITVNEYGLNVEQTIDKILSLRNEKKCKNRVDKKVIIELFVIAGLFLVLLFLQFHRKLRSDRNTSRFILMENL